MSVVTMVTAKTVTQKETKAGRNFVIITDSTGDEYSAFDAQLRKQALDVEGQLIKIEYDETEKNGFTNRYIRSIELISQKTEGDTTSERVPPSASATVDDRDHGQSPSETPEREGVWRQKITLAANKGEWRAADSLERNEHIERSVALNNAVEFFAHMREEDRKLSNLLVVFEHMLDILRGAK